MTANPSLPDPFHARDTFETGSGLSGIYRLGKLEDAGLTKIGRLPYSIRVLLEAVLRNCDGSASVRGRCERPGRLERVSGGRQSRSPSSRPGCSCRTLPACPRWSIWPPCGAPCERLRRRPEADQPARAGRPGDRPFGAGRFLRLARRHWRRTSRWNSSGTASATSCSAGGRRRSKISASCRLRSGIVHQVNLEFLAKCVFLREDAAGPVALPDTLVGTDSHTTMINGLGVLGWGVGGIEAEAVMLGQPLYMLAPEVVGFELSGQLPAGQHGHRPGAHAHANPPQRGGGEQVCRISLARR